MNLKFRIFIIDLLWKIPGISRRYCWADAVTWAYTYSDGLFHLADHECFYCLSCNTDTEIDKYHTSLEVQQP